MTTTPVFALRYKDGILIVCDTQIRPSRYPTCPQVERIIKIGDRTLIAASGVHADCQLAADQLLEEFQADFVANDGYEHGPAELSRLFARLAYQQRRKVDPYWGSFIIAGREKTGEFFLSTVNQYGLELPNVDYAATGAGHYQAMPYFQEHWKPGMTEEEARQLLLKVLVTGTDWLQYSGYHWQVTKVSAEGITVERPERIEGNWYQHTKFQVHDVPLCGMNY